MRFRTSTNQTLISLYVATVGDPESFGGGDVNFNSVKG